MTIAVSAMAWGSGSLNPDAGPLPTRGAVPRRPETMNKMFVPWLSRPMPMMIRLSLRWSTR